MQQRKTIALMEMPLQIYAIRLPLHVVFPKAADARYIEGTDRKFEQKTHVPCRSDGIKGSV